MEADQRRVGASQRDPLRVRRECRSSVKENSFAPEFAPAQGKPLSLERVGSHPEQGGYPRSGIPFGITSLSYAQDQDEECQVLSGLEPTEYYKEPRAQDCSWTAISGVRPPTNSAGGLSCTALLLGVTTTFPWLLSTCMHWWPLMPV